MAPKRKGDDSITTATKKLKVVGSNEADVLEMAPKIVRNAAFKNEEWDLYPCFSYGLVDEETPVYISLETMTILCGGPGPFEPVFFRPGAEFENSSEDWDSRMTVWSFGWTDKWTGNEPEDIETFAQGCRQVLESAGLNVESARTQIYEETRKKPVIFEGLVSVRSAEGALCVEVNRAEESGHDFMPLDPADGYNLEEDGNTFYLKVLRLADKSTHELFRFLDYTKLFCE